MDPSTKEILEMSFKPIDNPFSNGSSSIKDFELVKFEGNDWVVTTDPNATSENGTSGLIRIYDSNGTAIFEI